MNYYEHHIGDYDQATAHLSACEDGIYSRLIRWYMASESPLPADLKAIQRRVRARSREEREAVETILGEFFELCDDGYHQHRCDDEVARYKSKQDKAKASANARWNAQRDASERNANASGKHDATDMRTHQSSNANGMHRAPVPRHQTPDTITHSENASGVVSPSAPPADRGSRLPSDWTAPTDWITWCRQNRPDLDPVLIADQFRDFWLAKPGKDGRKSDWFATWRNWCRGQKTGPGRRGDDASDWTRSAA